MERGGVYFFGVGLKVMEWGWLWNRRRWRCIEKLEKSVLVLEELMEMVKWEKGGGGCVGDRC